MTKQDSSFSNAWQQGAESFLMGLDKTHNPHPAHTLTETGPYLEWIQGWDFARQYTFVRNMRDMRGFKP